MTFIRFASSESSGMVANPSLMREMTRNADRALGQLDAMPGGKLRLTEPQAISLTIVNISMTPGYNRKSGRNNLHVHMY